MHDGGRSAREIRDRAQSAVLNLEAPSPSPTPERCRLWLVHLADEEVALSRELQRPDAAEDAIDDDSRPEIGERLFVHAADERALLAAGKRLNELAAELSREASSLAGETARLGSSLTEAQRRVTGVLTDEPIRSILDVMVAETRRFAEQGRCAESNLRASMDKIEILRRDLQAAWSEARTDGLTGIANRKHFDQALRLATAQALEQGSAASLLLADIDHFRRLNDVHGPVLGDQVLRLLAALLKNHVKGQDLVARYGGEEFAVILPMTRLADATRLARRLCELVASRRVQLTDRGRTLGQVTLSIGVAEFRGGERCADWIARAEAVLYEAKRAGGNRVVVSEGPLEAADKAVFRGAPAPA